MTDKLLNLLALFLVYWFRNGSVHLHGFGDSFVKTDNVFLPQYVLKDKHAQCHFLLKVRAYGFSENVTDRQNGQACCPVGFFSEFILSHSSV